MKNKEIYILIFAIDLLKDLILLHFSSFHAIDVYL
jgi:hypothetical protein